MANCKPGDLAILIRDDVCPENVGAILEVLHFIEASHLPEAGLKWACVATGRPLKARQWADDGPGTQPFPIGYRYSQPGELIIAPDDYLRPITGLPDTEDTVRELELT